MAPRIPARPGGNKKPTVNPTLQALLDGNFFEFFFRLVTGDSGWFSSNGFIGGFLGRITEAATLTGMRWTQVDDLQDRTQQLEGVIGYGSARMSGHFTPGNSYTRCPFTTRVGPMVGMTHNSTSGYFVLGSKGLWEFSAKVIFDFLLFGSGADNGVFMDLVVYAPDGTEFYRAKNLTTSGPEVTLNETGRFVVPASGYRVEVQAMATINYRGMLGNIGFNQLNLLKISDETS